MVIEILRVSIRCVLYELNPLIVLLVLVPERETW